METLLDYKEFGSERIIDIASEISPILERHNAGVFWRSSCRKFNFDMILLIDKPKGGRALMLYAKVRGILHEKKLGMEEHLIQMQQDFL